MYLGYQNGQIKFYTEEPLQAEFYNLDKVEETELEYVLDGEEYVLKDEAWEEKQALIEKERIQELSMTRSDFFDGTIMAWGIGQDELLVLIQGLLATLPIEDVKKLIAINNFKNALNFYRKHDLFKMLVNIPIQLTETMQVILTDESLDFSILILKPVISPLSATSRVLQKIVGIPSFFISGIANCSNVSESMSACPFACRPRSGCCRLGLVIGGEKVLY